MLMMTESNPDKDTDGKQTADRDILLRKAKEFHGEICAGIVLGTRMTMIGMRELGMSHLEKTRNLIVYVEIDRCIADAIQAITGCSLGHRTLKYKPYGKFAATYVDLKTGTAVRVTVVEKKRTEKTGKEAMQDAAKILLDTPEADLFRFRRVNVTIPNGEMPGMPKFRARCSRCNEMVVDAKEITCGEYVLCGNCAGVPYYTEQE